MLIRLTKSNSSFGDVDFWANILLFRILTFLSIKPKFVLGISNEKYSDCCYITLITKMTYECSKIFVDMWSHLWTINQFKSEFFWENIKIFTAAQAFTIYSLKRCESLKRKLSSVHIGIALITFQFPKQITKKSKYKSERFSRKPNAAQRPW